MSQPSFDEIVNHYREELKKLQERKFLLGTGEKSTNIEVQLDKTIDRYDNTIRKLMRFQGRKL